MYDVEVTAHGNGNRSSCREINRSPGRGRTARDESQAERAGADGRHRDHESPSAETEISGQDSVSSSSGERCR